MFSNKHYYYYKLLYNMTKKNRENSKRWKIFNSLFNRIRLLVDRLENEISV